MAKKKRKASNKKAKIFTLNNFTLPVMEKNAEHDRKLEEERVRKARRAA